MDKPISWAILIPTLPERRPLLARLLKVLYKQIDAQDKHQIEVLVLPDNRQKTTGKKRNKLIDEAVKIGAKYVSFVDDDDLVGPTYVQRNLEGIDIDADCCSLWGQIYWSGKPGKPFHHSIQHKEWYEDNRFYYRTINHLNLVKLDLVKDIKFPDQNFGEDGKWAYAVRDAKVLRNEYKIDDILYHYYCGKK